MITRNLVNNCLNTKYEDIPQEVILHAKKSILNWMGVAIGAAYHPSVEMLISLKNDLQSSEQVSILGRREKADLLLSTLINGMSSHIFDYDDTHLDTIHHPSGPVAPVCFALAEKFNLSGKQVLRAFILGVEAELRISNAVCPSHYDLGWHITSTAGVFGAAVAAGILLELDEEQMLNALGLAGTQAFGLREMFGTMTKPFHPGKAAENGLLAALLAQKGFTSSKQVLEAKRGFANVTAPEHDLEQVNINWGTQWETLKNAFKPYACGIVLHPAIDACIALGKQVSDPSQVKEIEITVNPYVLELTAKPEPKTGLEGKFSIFHTGAMAFLEGDASEEQYQDAKVLDPKTLAFRTKIKPVVNESFEEDEAVAKLTTVDGKVYEYKVEHATGSIENPMTDEALCNKFRKVVKGILGSDSTEAIIAKLYDLDSVANINEVIPYCTPQTATV
ncbi:MULTISPECIES: MmgE/PrpD family protein [Paenibacillus]|uniref:MmgE/PrpD family protein n=1 Tax=Paenibacillus validus TaxID=44253 RepID=A0A7X3CTF8_9BACL|nr:MULTISPECIES: MmgE/PrpD family protein [Paenibacillus]MUG71052.1 MmgE/PrpD family protein [Paenibacillus validus]